MAKESYHSKTRIYAPRGQNRCSIEGCSDPYYGSGFCKKHHQWHWKRGLLPKPKETSIKEKIRGNVDIDPDSGCWEWRLGKNNKGYGRISLKGGCSRYAHRVAYQEFIGEIPEGMEVCHKCDNPACCNPKHLFVGSHMENMRDAINKGRLPEFPVVYGTDHPRALFNADQVRAIRRESRTPEQIALEYGCNPMTIRRVQKWETYQDTTCECSDGLPWVGEG